jgi:PAS domain S-box-containing protein
MKRAPLSGIERAELEARLYEAEETLDAIRNGEVDALVVGGPTGERVYTLANADRPYRVLIEQMQEGALTLSGDGIILYCNHRFAAIAGTPRESVLGESIDRFLGAEDRRTFRELLALGRGKGVSAEFALQSRAGIEVPVNISLVELKVEESWSRIVCGVVTDLTHNRRRNDELAAANARLATEIEDRRRAEESLRVALDAAGMGNWDLDLTTDTWHRSHRYDQIFGYAGPQPGWGLETMLAHFVPEDRAEVTEAFARAAVAGAIEIVARIERRDDAARRWLHVKGQTYYAAGKPVRIAGVVADITDRRAVEEQLRQAQKMEAMGQLTGGVAHDFNNLLMIIGGSLDMLSRRVAPDAKTTPLFEAARQGIARGAKLNQQLLAFSRRQELRAEITCVDDLVPTFEHLLDRAVGETVTIAIERAAALWSCRIDPHQLETAILNLAINARDAMPEGGTVTLATANSAVEEGVATLWDGGRGDYVVVSVADTGTCMAPDVLARAFDPFFTTKPLGQGTGLGLSMIYGFVRQSGGQVRVYSEVGKGTTMCLYFPRFVGTADEIVSAQEEVVERGFGESVLVVDDDATVRMLVAEVLTEQRYHVLEAADGPAALRIVESGARIDLMITDVGLPGGMNGRQVADTARLLRRDLKVLFITGYAENAAIGNGHLDHGMAILTKPFAMSTMGNKVREMLET